MIFSPTGAALADTRGRQSCRHRGECRPRREGMNRQTGKEGSGGVNRCTGEPPEGGLRWTQQSSLTLKASGKRMTEVFSTRPPPKVSVQDAQRTLAHLRGREAGDGSVGSGSGRGLSSNLGCDEGWGGVRWLWGKGNACSRPAGVGTAPTPEASRLSLTVKVSTSHTRDGAVTR